MSRLRIGVIGAGGIARIMHLPELAALRDRAEVVVLQGRKESRLKRLCAEYGVPRWTHDADAVLADPGLDAIVVATPHPLHVAPGIKALKAGKHLFMQKPLCGEMREADDFVAAAEATDRVTLVLPHFRPEVVGARDRVEAGTIGKVSGARMRTSHGGPEVYYAQVREALGEPAGDLWFFDAKQAAVGALFDMGVYAVATLVALLGTVRRVTGAVATLDKPTPLEDTATLLLEFASGAIATAETGWCDPARTWEFSVHGTRGKLTSDGDGLTLWEPGSYTREDVPSKESAVDLAPHRRGSAHAHFLDCVERSVRPPLSHARAARHVTEVLLAGLRAAREGRAVDVASAAA